MCAAVTRLSCKSASRRRWPLIRPGRAFWPLPATTFANPPMPWACLWRAWQHCHKTRKLSLWWPVWRRRYVHCRTCWTLFLITPGSIRRRCKSSPRILRWSNCLLSCVPVLPRWPRPKACACTSVQAIAGCAVTRFYCIECCSICSTTRCNTPAKDRFWWPADRVRTRPKHVLRCGTAVSALHLSTRSGCLTNSFRSTTRSATAPRASGWV